MQLDHDVKSCVRAAIFEFPTDQNVRSVLLFLKPSSSTFLLKRYLFTFMRHVIDNTNDSRTHTTAANRRLLYKKTHVVLFI